MLTEKEAQEKVCHRSLAPTVVAGEANYLPTTCSASECMAWRWGPKPWSNEEVYAATAEISGWLEAHPMPPWTRTDEVTAWEKLANAYLDGLSLIVKPPEGAGWELKRLVNEDEVLMRLYWEKPRPRKGYCGLAGEVRS